LKGAEVVTKIATLSVGEITVHEMGVMTDETIADPIVVEELRQEEWEGVTHRVSLASELAKTNSESLNLAVVRDEFDADTFDENLDNEQHIEENDELAGSESDEKTCNVQLIQPPMHRSAQLAKAMRLMCSPQWLLYVMFRHQVALTGIHITQMKSCEYWSCSI
jgi:maltodextrin utilization protein YvdJ